MRWLLVSRQHHPAHGGIGTYVQRFCRAARSHGWHVELVTQRDDDFPPCAQVHQVRTLDMMPEFQSRIDRLREMHRVRPYRYALWSKAVAERLLSIRGDFDAVEFVDCQAEGFASLGCAAVRERFSNAAFIVHAHTPMFVEEQINGVDESLFGRSIYHGWEQRALTMADGLITTSSVMTPWLARSATIIPYPIEDDLEPRRTKCEERILLVGTLQPRKGIETWVRSLRTVFQQRPRATALLIGADTPSAPGGYSMAAHVQRLLEPPVRDRFCWTGSLSHQQTCDLIGESSLLVVPSLLESFSFAATEALLAGTPVIVSDRTGIAEHVPLLRRVACHAVGAWATAQVEALSDIDAAMEHAFHCRAEMLESCAPLRVLASRAALVESVASNYHAHARAATEQGDSLAEMARFISEVDAQDSGCPAEAAASIVAS
jgi:glycosyltransferase involved in cell wall biosynthesis